MRVTSVASSIERVGQQGHVPSTSERERECGLIYNGGCLDHEGKLCPMPGP